MLSDNWKTSQADFIARQRIELEVTKQMQILLGITGRQIIRYVFIKPTLTYINNIISQDIHSALYTLRKGKRD